MAKLKQGSLFDDPELEELRERQRRLDEAHKEVVNLPAKLERERRERESTMPPMAEIREREQIKEFEKKILSRGQVENTLRVQRQSLAMLLLLATATVLMLFWAYRIAFP